jgi:hypothetical protein
MRANDSTSKHNKLASSNRIKGVEPRTGQKMIETRNCRNPTKHARTQTHGTGHRQKALKTSSCLSSAELARRKQYKTRKCLSSARARPAETATRLSTMLSPTPGGTLQTKKSKQTPKNWHDSSMSPYFSVQRANQQDIFSTERIVESEPKNIHPSKIWKVRPKIITFTRNKLIKHAITGTKSKILLKKREFQKPKSAGAGKSPKIAHKRILEAILSRVKVNQFPTVNLKPNSNEIFKPTGFSMGKKQGKKQKNKQMTQTVKTKKVDQKKKRP